MAVVAPPTAGIPREVAGNASLFVNDLDPAVTENELFQTFRSAGSVTSVKVVRDNVTRESLGRGYVNFMSHGDAVNALENLNYAPLHGKAIRLMWAERDASKRANPEANVYIKGLPEDASMEELHSSCSEFGNVVSVKISTDGQGKSRGFGYVQFASSEEANKCISELNGSTIGEQKLVAEKFKPRAQRTANSWTNIFFKNCPREWTQADLEAMLKPFGNVTSTFFTTDKEGKPTGVAFANMDTHEAAERAVAELDGKEHEITMTVTEDGQEKEIKVSKPLYAARAQPKAERQREQHKLYDEFRRARTKRMRECNLVVANLADTLTKDELMTAFSEYGAVESCTIATDAEGKSLGYGFVMYESAESAAKALGKTQGLQLKGKPLKTSMWLPKGQRDAMKKAKQTQATPAGGMGMPFGGAMSNPAFFAGIPHGMVPAQQHGNQFMTANWNAQLMWQQQQQLAQMQQRGGAMAGYPAQMQQQMAAQQAQQPVVRPAQPTFSLEQVAAMDPSTQQEKLGTALHAKFHAVYPEMAGKLTGVLLHNKTVEQLVAILNDEALFNENMQKLHRKLSGQ